MRNKPTKKYIHSILIMFYIMQVSLLFCFFFLGTCIKSEAWNLCFCTQQATWRHMSIIWLIGLLTHIFSLSSHLKCNYLQRVPVKTWLIFS